MEVSSCSALLSDNEMFFSFNSSFVLSYNKSRYLNCHSECSDYIAYRKERDELLEIKAKKIKEICDVKAFNVKETSRLIKRKGTYRK